MGFLKVKGFLNFKVSNEYPFGSKMVEAPSKYWVSILAAYG